MKITAGGIPLGEDFYTGRQIVVDQLRELTQAHKNILILGPRRTGKTSSIQELIRQETESRPEEFRYVFIDLENTQNVYEFYLRIIKEILAATQKYKHLLDNSLDKIKAISNKITQALKLEADIAPYLGVPSEVKLTLQLPSFNPATVNELANQLHLLISSLKMPILIVLDEFPELIWKFGQLADPANSKAEMRDKTQYLLNGLRILRQEQCENKQRHSLIIAGSINLDNTLKYLELESTINDLERLHIPYLSPDQCCDLAKKLFESEEITFEDDAVLISFIKSNFGFCSPFYVQSFASIMRQMKIDNMGGSNFAPEAIKRAYKDLISRPGGPEYFYTRLQRFYAAEKSAATAIIKIVVTHQFSQHTGLESSVACSQAGLDQETYTTVIAKMLADDMIQHLDDGSKIGFKSALLCNFWNYRLADGRYLND